MQKPKPLSVDKPVKLIFVGGFLGSGKTTALGIMARDIIRKGMRVGIVTNDQSANLADTVIVQQMLEELGVPIEEVVAGCFCCKFDELIDQIEKILIHEPDVLMGEPVGSCTDFVAAVANPIKIHYQEAFTFAPFCTMVDPVRVRELLLKEVDTTFPEEVAYLFGKQLEEADLIVLNKCDLLADSEKEHLIQELQERFPEKTIMAVSAREGHGMEDWLDTLLTARPGAGTVLAQLDYDRYAKAEAVLGWLNAAVKLTGNHEFNPSELMHRLMLNMRAEFQKQNAGIGHLKFVMTGGGKSMWANLTHLHDDPTISQQQLGGMKGGTLIVNARVQIEPASLEAVVRSAIKSIEKAFSLDADVLDLQCFRPAYPNPPYLERGDAAQ
jgi:G3E family GTPase